VRLVLCTSGGAPGAAVLGTLRRSDKIEVVGVLRSTRILSPRYSFARGALEQYRKSGLAYTMYLACACARPLPAAGLPLHATRDVNDRASRAFIERLAPELLVSAFFNQRIGSWATGVNLHPSLLPALRGTDPVFQAMLRGERRLGVTLHRLAPELDAGDIIAQREAPRVAGESVLGATLRLYALGARLLLDSLKKINSGTATPQPASGDYASWPTREQVAALRAKGIRLARARDLLARAA
jgi:methionyl-tRNA formyltransferase